MKTILKLQILFFLSTMFLACSKMDDYKKYISDEEIIYIGKPDSVRVFSGKDRVQLQWLIISDPKVVGATVYWANKSQQKSIPITRGPGIDTIYTYIDNLEQGFHSFELHTFDKEGNTSVPVIASGMVYGTSYERALPNRSVEGVRYAVGGNTYVTWRTADSTSIGIRVMYTDLHGINQIKTVLNIHSETELIQYDVSKAFTYQTMYKPDHTAIDTFYAPVVSQMANEILLKNAGYPFRGVRVSGRFGNLADWDANEAIKTRNGVGGFDNYNGGGYLSMEYWWSPQIINGKLSQTLILPPGQYRYVAHVSSINNNPEATFLAVSAGNSLPNTEDINSALGYFSIVDNSQQGKDISVSFQLDTPQSVTLGFVTTMQQRHETSIRISSVKLFRQ